MKNHRTDGHRCRHCKIDGRFKLLSLEDVMELKTDSDQIFSLKVFAAAFTVAMGEFTVEESFALLEVCGQEIARGHTLVVR